MATTVQGRSKESDEVNKTLRRRFKCFRVLILGRANAGKTTILQKVCNTDEQPVIFDSKGNKASDLGISDVTSFDEFCESLLFRSTLLS